MPDRDDSIPVGACIECRSPVHTGEPQTMLEAWSGRNCYCPDCLEQVVQPVEIDPDASCGGPGQGTR
jgi:hypothetical protein